MGRENRLSLVIQESEGLPKHFEFRKSYITHLLLILVTLTIILSFSLFIFLYFHYKDDKVEGLVETRIKDKMSLLQEKLSGSDTKELEQQIALLQKKVTIEDLGTNQLGLYLFKPIKSFSDLSTKFQNIDFDSYQLKAETNKTTISFNIINKNQDESKKLSGHIFVIANVGQKILVYPENSFDQQGLLAFHNGEQFSTSKLRPVNATFSEVINPHSIRIIIFDRTGNLIASRGLDAKTFAPTEQQPATQPAAPTTNPARP